MTTISLKKNGPNTGSIFYKMASCLYLDQTWLFWAGGLGTRNAMAGKLSEDVAVNITTHGFTMFKFKGPKVFNNIKDFYLYTD